MRRLLCSLWDMYENGGRKRLFATDYAGSYQPPQKPHRCNWRLANEHWLLAASAFLASSDAVIDLPHDRLILLAEEITLSRLWWQAIKGDCYACHSVDPRGTLTRK